MPAARRPTRRWRTSPSSPGGRSPPSRTATPTPRSPPLRRTRHPCRPAQPGFIMICPSLQCFPPSYSCTADQHMGVFPLGGVPLGFPRRPHALRRGAIAFPLGLRITAAPIVDPPASAPLPLYTAGMGCAAVYLEESTAMLRYVCNRYRLGAPWYPVDPARRPGAPNPPPGVRAEGACPVPNPQPFPPACPGPPSISIEPQRRKDSVRREGSHPALAHPACPVFFFAN